MDEPELKDAGVMKRFLSVAWLEKVTLTDIQGVKGGKTDLEITQVHCATPHLLQRTN